MRKDNPNARVTQRRNIHDDVVEKSAICQVCHLEHGTSGIVVDSAVFACQCKQIWVHRLCAEKRVHEASHSLTLQCLACQTRFHLHSTRQSFMARLFRMFVLHTPLNPLNVIGAISLPNVSIVIRSFVRALEIVFWLFLVGVLLPIIGSTVQRLGILQSYHIYTPFTQTLGIAWDVYRQFYGQNISSTIHATNNTAAAAAAAATPREIANELFSDTPMRRLYWSAEFAGIMLMFVSIALTKLVIYAAQTMYRITFMSRARVQSSGECTVQMVIESMTRQ